MIGKIIIGKSFRGCLMYCLNDKLKKHPNDEDIFKERAEIISFNQCNGTAQELIRQFNQVRQLNPKLSKPVLHITLSLSPGESLTKNKLMETAEQCAKEFGFEKNQYVSVLHKDTRHQHIHIVANRIGFNKKTVSDNNNYKKVAGFCRKIEIKHKLQQVQSPRRFLSNNQQIIPSQDKRKMMMQELVKESLLKSTNYPDFERLMKEKNYKVIKSRGISFIDDKKVYVKGSEIGFSLQTIERILDQQNRQSLSQQVQLLPKHSFHQPGDRVFSNAQALNKRLSISKDLSNVVNKTVEVLINPKEINEQVPHQLLQKKKKKQQHRMHL